MAEPTATHATIEQTQEKAAASGKGEKRKPTKGASKQAQTQGKPRAQRQPIGKYTFPATVIAKTVKVGNSDIAYQLKRHWPQIDFAIHYSTVFAPQQIKGKIPKLVNEAMGAYVSTLVREVEDHIARATALADDAGISVGAALEAQTLELTVTSRTSKQVLDVLRSFDDYLLLIDSLWIEGQIDETKRDEAHEYVRNTMRTIHRLASRSKEKLVDHRKAESPDQSHAIEAQLADMIKALTNVEIAVPSRAPQPAAQSQQVEQATESEERPAPVKKAA